MSEKYERVGLRSIAEGKLALVLLAGGAELGKTLSVDMPIHKVKKNVKRYYKDGRYVESSELNAYKYETLALDLVHMMDSCLAFEIEREKEFAPIKNKEGKDSLDTARELLKMNGWEL